MTKLLLGIDIGGTKIRAVLLYKNKVARALELQTPKTKPQFVTNLSKLASFAASQKIPIGIGVAGTIKNTTAVFCPNISYLKKFDFKKIFTPGVKLKIDNDARCSARAEANLGAGKKFKKIFVATIGTGVGRACAEKGCVKKIKRFEYPEKWEKEYQRVRAKGSAAALATFLGRKLITLIKQFGPEALILGGGALANQSLFFGLQRELKQAGFAKSVLRARFKKNSAAIGAALQNIT